MIQKLIYSFLFFVLLSCQSPPAHKELSEAQRLWSVLPLQDSGRVKPFDSLAREVLREIYGKESYKGRSAVEIILSWLLAPDLWEETELIKVETAIKKSLKLPLKPQHFPPAILKSHPRLALQLTELKNLRQREEPLEPYFQKLEKLERRLILYSAILSGALIRLQAEKEAWRSLPEMSPPVEEQFKKLLSAYSRLVVQAVSHTLSDKNWPKQKIPEEPSVSLIAGGKKPSPLLLSFKKEMEHFQKISLKGQSFSHKISAELFYNRFDPFKKAWIFYLLFLLTLPVLLIFQRMDLFKWTLPLTAIGFASHSGGLILRSYIMSRPPVSNMYETVVWVPWVAFLAGALFYLRGARLPFIAGSFLAFFCLFLTHLSPEILDESLQPLEAVLRSSFWLATHVLVITMSYSFFFLAFVLGDMVLISSLFKNQPDWSQKIFPSIYRSIQWGVVFLAGGTVLGGIWADYSWGRFWGWDPKESWALVSLLSYLSLLHGRLVAWIGPFGMAVGAVMMFFTVIMAWYGVNFVLGAGLHSYGFGSGGLEWVAGFLVLHLLLCGTAVLKKSGIGSFMQSFKSFKKNFL